MSSKDQTRGETLAKFVCQAMGIPFCGPSAQAIASSFASKLKEWREADELDADLAKDEAALPWNETCPCQ